MKVKCPKCGEELEMPDGKDGRHLQCSYCNARFIAIGGKRKEWYNYDGELESTSQERE